MNLPLEENGYPSLEALKAAVGETTALIMINNPDDMGIYNPEIREWVRVAKEAGATLARTVVIPGRRYERFTSLEEFREFEQRGLRSLQLADWA